MKKIIKLNEKDLNRLVKKIINESKHKKELNLRKKLDDMFFGNDPMNISSDSNEFGYLSQEHRLSKKISPRQRIERIKQVIDELENYIQDLKYSISGEQSFTMNKDYENIWSDLEKD